MLLLAGLSVVAEAAQPAGTIAGTVTGPDGARLPGAYTRPTDRPGRCRTPRNIANIFDRAYVEHLPYQRDPYRSGHLRC